MAASSEFITLVGEHLRMIRKEKGLTQEALAEIAGIARARISDIENAKKNTTLETLERIIDALGITPFELFDFKRLDSVNDITNKKLLVDIHRSILLERDLGEIKYVVNTTKEFLDTIDKK